MSQVRPSTWASWWLQIYSTTEDKLDDAREPVVSIQFEVREVLDHPSGYWGKQSPV